ncbi:hypothetical protein CMV_029052 [Castanea mollissima]|uniref:Uncharacterized protein n=1 Tax=Castanea mollissima TaxID=60419 RepID=A0A8J4QCS8_9ROSI|nr:hypothetical protein CMV_029052 [Castanea mollissima]
MGSNMEEKVILHGESKDVVEHELEESVLASLSTSPARTSRPSSMVFKATHSMIPAHLVAGAISTLHGLDLRWSGPITPTEMEYVKQYVFVKYQQYCNGLVEEGHNKFDLDNLSIKEESTDTLPDDKRKSPKNTSSNLSDLDKAQLEPSRLLEILTKKSSFQGSFISIPEIQAMNRALKHCGLSEKDYLVLFMPNYKDAMMMIGESYPFFGGNFYLTIISEEFD